RLVDPAGRGSGQAILRDLPHRQRLAGAIALAPRDLLLGPYRAQRRRGGIKPIEPHAHRLARACVDQAPPLKSARLCIAQLRLHLAVDAGEATRAPPTPIIIEAFDPADLAG